MEELESRLLLSVIPLTVNVTGVGVAEGDADFFAAVTIAGVRQETPHEFGSSEFVNWRVTQPVEDSAGGVPVKIELFDGNDDNSSIDIDPDPGDQSIDLSVDPLTGFYVGDVTWPDPHSAGGGDGRAGSLSFGTIIPGVTSDTDGDGLLDGWERNGLDVDVNRGNGVAVPLNTWGANPNHKDLFLEFDWMAGAVPTRDAIQAIKTAFAVAPIDAGTDAESLLGGLDAMANPDGLPGINLWIDTGGLMNASGQLVGDNLGGGNQVPTTNVSALTTNFYNLKNGTPTSPANFNAARRFVFRYGLSSADPINIGGTSSGGNSSTTLNDTAQSWVANEWKGNTVTITGGTGAGQTATIESHTATQLTLTAATAWATTPDNTSTYAINWGIGGEGEVGGNDFVEYNHDAGTIMHELGHTLNLRHGGADGDNCKPNYISVMSYDLQFGIPQNSGATIIDYSAPRISFGGRTSGGNAATTFNDTAQTWIPNQWAGGYVDVVVANVRQTRRVVTNTPTQLVLAEAWTTVPFANTPYALFTASPARGAVPLPSMTENALLETIIFDITDNANRMVFTNSAGRKTQYPLNGLNRDGVGIVDGPDFDNDLTVDSAPVAVNVDTADNNGTPMNPADDQPADCSNTIIRATPLEGHDDWRHISLPFRQFGDSRDSALRREIETPPRLTDLLELQARLDTSDVKLSVSTSATTVVQGDHLVYTFTATVDGSNPADGVTAADLLPAGVTFVAASASQGTSTLDGNTVRWDLGTIWPGMPVTFRLEVVPCLVGTLTNTATVSSIDTDPVADNNSATAQTTVLNAAPVITFVGLDAAVIRENDTDRLTVRFTDAGACDTHTAQIDWGDGPPESFDVPVGQHEFSLSHRYLDDDPATGTPQDTFVVRVTIVDNNGGSDTDSAPALVVENVDPVMTTFTSDGSDCGDRAEGDTVHVTGTFADVGTLDSHTATIDWGDGMTTPATIVEAGGAGTVAGSHVYASGGIFRLVATLIDDDTGQTTARTFTFITGVGILDGQLQIVGTKQADDVHVNLTGGDRFAVHASFLADSPRLLSAAGVSSIAMILCEGDDQASVASNIRLATYVAGEEGNDKLTGGGGPNILLGGEGDDQIIGGDGHDILVGGTGADRIVGNGGDDILIAGTLAAASDPLDQIDEMLDILAEWSRLRNRALTQPRLVVEDDDDVDRLTGGSGFDWFFYDLTNDVVTDGEKRA